MSGLTAGKLAAGTLTVGILLAAGRSRRFGAGDKLLAPLDGRPLVSHAAAALAASGVAPLAAVVSSPAVAALLPGFDLLRLAPDLPMSRSFAAALDHARRLGAARMLICLGDMPGVTEGLLARLLAQPGSAACRFAGRRLPPACIAAGDFPAALALPEGDHGARALIAGVPEARLIALSAAEARDVDRPGDLAGIWRGRDMRLQPGVPVAGCALVAEAARRDGPAGGIAA